MKLTVRLALLAALALPGAALPTPAEDRALGVEFQRYPVGTIVSLAFRQPIAERGDLWLSIGSNDADRDDNGEFDDEQAEGIGLSLGYRHWRSAARRGWSLGARLDLWDLDVDWFDAAAAPGEMRGRTETLALQPTVVLGHAWRPGTRGWTIEATLAAGAEINIETDGPDVGEGAILLGGVGLFKRF